MCVARTSKAAARLSASFRTRNGVEKIYHAIVAGKISGSGTREDFVISQGNRSALDCKDGRGPRTAIHRSGPLLETHAETRSHRVGGAQVSTLRGVDSSPQPASCVTRSPGAKHAILEWMAIELRSPGAYAFRCRQTGTPLSLLRLRLVTGRKHQIRAQLAAMGYPVVGDVRYGRGGTAAGLFPLADRSILLHASGLVVPHPTRRGETVRVVAPPPEAWSKVCGKSIVDEVLADARR